MDLVKDFTETGRLDLKEFFKSLPKCSDPSFPLQKASSPDANLQNWTPAEAVNITELEHSFFKSILEDDKPLFLDTAKLFVTERGSTIDRSVASKLLHSCCAYDSIDCTTSLINGELGAVPLVNEVDPSAGLSPLHVAAEAHAVRCVELLLKKRARTDLRTRDGRGLLPLELSLSGRRMDVSWNPDDYSVKHLVDLLRKKDLTAVKLLTEKRKEVDEVAYANAIDGRIVPLAALLIVAAEKVIDADIELQDADLGPKQKTTIYECVIKEALSLGRATTTSSGAAIRTCAPSRDQSSVKRKLLLCEMELLQIFGAGTAAQTGVTEKKLMSPLIRGTQDGDEAVIELLLETNININDTDAEGNSALHWSLKMSWGSLTDQMKIIWLLLKHGARVTQRNKLGLTAFHFAAANGNSQALQLLLLESPDGINSKTEMKETPLFFAVKNDHMDCAELLLQRGADSEVFNLRRQRPLELAKSQDMRFMLNPTNISFMKRGSPIQQKHPDWLRADEAVSDTFDALFPTTDDDTAFERNSSNKKTEICKYFESPTGCIRGSKCLFAHGQEELRQKQGTHTVHCPSVQELKRKIFVGGLPSSLDSDSLGKFFGEQFGSVEDAVVIGNQTRDHRQSRGFGFVTFKHERSVSDAVQAHYVSIMGKKVEIKSAIRKSVLLNESKKLSLRRYGQEERNKNQLQGQTCNEDTTDMPGWYTKEEAKSETISWADRLLQGQPNSCSSELKTQGFVHENMPSWFKTFRKWLPSMLENVSRDGKEEEYPLSSLKADFKATFGLELNHASLGYPKLSDFMRYISDLCQMKVVPIGRRGPATHMVLLPSLPKPPSRRCEPLKLLCPSYAAPADVSGNGDSNDSKCPQDLLLVSGENISSYSTSIEIGSPSEEVPDENYAQKKNSTLKDTAHSASSRFLQFLKPESLGNAQELSYNKRNVVSGDDDDRGGIEASNGRKCGDWQRHSVLETLARKQNSKSKFFLREYDFYKRYKASIFRGKCFCCEQSELLWANFPCQHLVWCSDCKLHAERAARDLDHRCVVCDVEVQKIILDPSKGYYQHQPLYKDVPNDDEFPPFSATDIRISLRKKSL